MFEVSICKHIQFNKQIKIFELYIELKKSIQNKNAFLKKSVKFLFNLSIYIYESKI